MTGTKGEHGEEGQRGKDGRIGVEGPIGEKGIDGSPGMFGRPGLHGKKGSPVKSKKTFLDKYHFFKVEICCRVRRAYLAGQVAKVLKAPKGSLILFFLSQENKALWDRKE